MTNCLFCYQNVEDGEYHSACTKKFFGTSSIPSLELDQEKLNKLPQLTVNERLAVTSVQPGNNDMHLKNFSLMHTEKGILLAPAYDLLNVNLVFPKDEEDLALTLNGRKKKIKRVDFDQFASSLGIPDKVRDTIYKAFSSKNDAVKTLIERSFLNEEYKSGYYGVFVRKLAQVGLVNS